MNPTNRTAPLDAPLVISLGDPAGVGPELIAAAWAARHEERLAPFFVAGSAEVLRQAAASRGIEMPVHLVGSPDEALSHFDRALPVLDIGESPYTPGEPSDEGANLALRSLEIAIGMVRNGAACALVTAPVAKARLARVGFTHPGQTEFVAEACGITAENAVMMLAGPSLRVVPITVHTPLSTVPGLLTCELIRSRAAIAAAALTRDFGLAAPRLAIAGLNPHAGEDGRMGTEEIEVIAPAVEALQACGINAFGPLPPDGMFHAQARGGYDLAICMYHDQALIPLKALDFDQGVNVTLGLPVIRTSPDHGTAFALAGKNLARPGATIAAIRMAGECAAARAATAS